MSLYTVPPVKKINLDLISVTHSLSAVLEELACNAKVNLKNKKGRKKLPQKQKKYGLVNHAEYAQGIWLKVTIGHHQE